MLWNANLFFDSEIPGWSAEGWQAREKIACGALFGTFGGSFREMLTEEI
jgi:hypothetical protein